MQKKKKIVIVTTHIDGGIGTFLNQLAQLSFLKKHTIDFSILILQKQVHMSLTGYSYISSFTNSPKKQHAHFNITETIRLIPETLWLKQELSGLKPDLLLSMDLHASILACIQKKLYFKKVKLIISNRNNIEKVLRNKLSPLERLLFKRISQYLFLEADKIVCVSKGVTKNFKKFLNLNKNIYTIYNGIDTKKAEKLGQKSIHESFFSKRKKTIISIGRFEEQKDFETLITAIEVVRRTIKNIQLLIIGDGQKKQQLETMILNKHLETSIFIIGWKKNVYPYLRKSDLFVFSSYYEGFGYVLIEAMSQGIPIVSTNSPFGPSEILASGKYGILSPIENPESLGKNICRILMNKKIHKYYSLQSKKRVSFFSEEKMVKKYQKLFSL